MLYKENGGVQREKNNTGERGERKHEIGKRPRKKKNIDIVLPRCISQQPAVNPGCREKAGL